MKRPRRMPIRASDLAQMLGVTAKELRGVLSGTRPTRRRGEPKYRWRDLLPRLTREQLADLSAAERRRRMATPTSRRWLAGYSRLVADWHPTRNGTLYPDEVSYGSQRYLWWKCPAGPDHEWRARAAARVRGDGCPFCVGQKVSVTNSLATLAPEIAREWHPTRNGRLTPKDVTWSTGRDVWWKCARGLDHEWRARVNSRTSSGTTCPFCAGRRVSVTNSLGTVAPGIAAQWHRSRNGRLRPTDLVAYSTRMVWWQCPAARDHVWREMPSVRISHTRGCPFCAGKRLARSNSLAARAPHLVAEWHPTRNGELGPEGVTSGSHRRVWWRCKVDPRHEWKASVLNRAREHVRSGSGCPICYRKHRAQ